MRRVVAGIVLLAALVVAPQAGAQVAPRPRVLLFGDSLLVEAASQVRTMAAKAGVDVDVEALGGTAVCDWIPAAPATRARFRPDVVVLAFYGNNLTPCTRDALQRTVTGPALGMRYLVDVLRMIDTLRGVRSIYLVRPPAPKWWNVGAQAVDAAYVDTVLLRPGTRVIEGGGYISPGRVWSATQPCLKEEPCVGPTINRLRRNVVRAGDGLHFCPTGYANGRCAEWSSGAYRYARAIMEPLLRDLRR